MSKSWSKSTRYLAFVIMLAAAIWFLVAARGLISPLLISALLAYIFNPAISFVNTRTKLPRNWVVLLVYLLLLATLITLGIIFVPVIPEQVTALINQVRDIIITFEENLIEPVYFLGFVIPVADVLSSIPLEELVSFNFVRADIVLNVLSVTTTNLGWLLVILVTTYYLLQDWGRLRDWLLKLPPTHYQTDAVRLYHDINQVWRRYFRGQLRLMLIIGILTGLGSAAVGLPGAVAFGVLAGVLDIILSVGPAVVMAIAALVALFAGSTFLPMTNEWFTVLVLAIYGLIQMVENVWLRPRIMGDTLRIHPAIVFIAVIGSLALAGILTALIIIPVIGSVAILVRYIYAKMFDMNPWPEGEPSWLLAATPTPETIPTTPEPAADTAVSHTPTTDTPQQKRAQSSVPSS